MLVNGSERAAAFGRALRDDEPQPHEPLDLPLHPGRPAAGETDELAQVVRASRLHQQEAENARAGLGAEERRQAL